MNNIPCLWSIVQSTHTSRNNHSVCRPSCARRPVHNSRCQSPAHQKKIILNASPSYLHNGIYSILRALQSWISKNQAIAPIKPKRNPAKPSCAQVAESQHQLRRLDRKHHQSAMRKISPGTVYSDMRQSQDKGKPRPREKPIRKTIKMRSAKYSNVRRNRSRIPYHQSSPAFRRDQSRFPVH